MAKVTLRGRGSDGKVAIWTGDDDDPFDSPLDHLDRLKFHSSLDYPKVIDEWSGTVNFPARTEHRSSPFSGYFADNGVVTQSYTLFAHGRGGQPWILGSAEVGGANVAFVGSVPVQQAIDDFSPFGPEPWVRWVSIGADDTNVYAFEYTVVTRNASTEFSGIRMPAISIPIKIWVTDELLS
jgi:hypothetical protein